jgi:PAS domain S-box-containing protein
MGELLKTLIVEDSEDDCLLLVDELRQQGFDPRWERVQTGSAMKESLEQRDWNCVLSDFSMPKFDAPSALRVLQESWQDLPFIVISGTIGEEIAVETMRAGAHDYLMKGHLKRLGQAIRRELRDAEVRRERKLGIAKIQHLNRVLRAIRKVNQLIVQEKDSTRLLERACDLLIETHGYTSALAVRTDDALQPRIVAHSMTDGRDPRPALDGISDEGLTTCMKLALESAGPLVVESDTPDCGVCSLHSAHSKSQRVVQRLVHEGMSYGFVIVALPEGFSLDTEEIDIFDEVVCDIAFALHGIEQEKTRKKAEESLRESEERYRLLAENATDVIWVLDAESQKFTYASPAVERVLGFTDKESVGRTVANMTTPASLEFIKSTTPARIERALQGGTDIYTDHIDMVHKDGRVVPTEINMRFVLNPRTGRAEGTGVMRDIAERKQMQSQLAQSDRMASMGMLAAGVAHEINNPLAYVLYNLESLTDDLPKLSSALRKCLGIVGERVGDEEWASLMGKDQELLNPAMLDDIRARFKDALQGSHRIKDVARGLGTFSRVERDRLVPVALMHVIEVAINMVFNEIKYRARLVKEYGKTSTIMANDGRLSQVFLNLLINAAHAIGDGDQEGNEIRVRTWQEGDEVFAEVRDTGKGIAKEHLPQLFEPFFSTKEMGVGTGLGLPISKTIVEEYGGRIEVESEVGKGTRFVVRLPVNKATEEDEAAQRDQVVVQTGGRGRILVVDDEAGIRAAMVRILRGHDVVQAVSGGEAQKILEADQAFDLILCDMMMPVMSGVDLHEWLLTTHPELAKQIVFITGGAFTPKAREHLSKVSNIRIEKPFDVANFKNIVGELIVAYRNRGS